MEIKVKTVRNNQAKLILTHGHHTTAFVLPMQAIYNQDAQELLSRAGEIFNGFNDQQELAQRLYQEIHAHPIIQAQIELDRLRSLVCA